jgi:hypothetical protein
MRTMSQMVGASYRCRGISGANERTAGLRAWRLGSTSSGSFERPTQAVSAETETRLAGFLAVSGKFPVRKTPWCT